MREIIGTGVEYYSTAEDKLLYETGPTRIELFALTTKTRLTHSVTKTIFIDRFLDVPCQPRLSWTLLHRTRRIDDLDTTS